MSRFSPTIGGMQSSGYTDVAQLGQQGIDSRLQASLQLVNSLMSRYQANLQASQAAAELSLREKMNRENLALQRENLGETRLNRLQNKSLALTELGQRAQNDYEGRMLQREGLGLQREQLDRGTDFDLRKLLLDALQGDRQFATQNRQLDLQGQQVGFQGEQLGIDRARLGLESERLDRTDQQSLMEMALRKYLGELSAQTDINVAGFNAGARTQVDPLELSASTASLIDRIRKSEGTQGLADVFAVATPEQLPKLQQIAYDEMVRKLPEGTKFSKMMANVFDFYLPPSETDRTQNQRARISGLNKERFNIIKQYLPYLNPEIAKKLQEQYRGAM